MADNEVVNRSPRRVWWKELESKRVLIRERPDGKNDSPKFSRRSPFFGVRTNAFHNGLARLVSDKIHSDGCGTNAGTARKKINDEQMTYYFPDVVVYFYFTSNPKCRQKVPYSSWDVTSDTLTGIDISLRHPPSVEETGIDLTKFKKIKAAADMINHYYYVSPDDDGFAIEVGNNYVGGYHYGPGSKHKNLRCEPSTQR